MNTFVVADSKKCIGCRSCEIACSLAHMQADLITAAAWDAPFRPRLTLVRGPMVAMPIQCRQCEDAPCAKACPENAIAQGPYFIEINQEACTGCKSCLLACPFGAMDMAPLNQNEAEAATQPGLKVIIDGQAHDKLPYVATKCDLCKGRAQGPACVEICPAKALLVISAKTVRKNLKKRQLAGARELARSLTAAGQSVSVDS